MENRKQVWVHLRLFQKSKVLFRLNVIKKKPTSTPSTLWILTKRELQLSMLAESAAKHKPTTLVSADKGAARHYTTFA